MSGPTGRVKLYFVRHGETAWSITGQHTGTTDLELTENGEEKARRLEPWLKGVAFTHVFCSPRRRARRTCELAGLLPSAEIVADLAEWNYGQYEGLRSVDIQKLRPDWDIYLDGCPGGKSAAEIEARADRLIERLLALEGDIALFSHGHFGRVFASRWIAAPIVFGKHFSLGTGSLSILSSDERHPETRVFELWNAMPAGRDWTAAVASRVMI